MREIFVDASFWIALRDGKDPLHVRAIPTAKRLGEQRRRLVTTFLVFGEIHAYFSRFTELREQIIRDFWPGGVARIEHPEHSDFANAFELLRKSGDKSYSFCDAVSFTTMHRLGITEALSYDHHFRQIGEFEIL